MPTGFRKWTILLKYTSQIEMKKLILPSPECFNDRNWQKNGVYAGQCHQAFVEGIPHLWQPQNVKCRKIGKDPENGHDGFGHPVNPKSCLFDYEVF